ncbi:hypothetical protein AOLI_G00103800 [Acnodon oligacanthus]
MRGSRKAVPDPRRHPPLEMRRLLTAYPSCSAANCSPFHALTLWLYLFSCGGRSLFLCLLPGDAVLSRQISSQS